LWLVKAIVVNCTLKRSPERSNTGALAEIVAETLNATAEKGETMAKDHGPSVKDDALYEKLREEGESKEKAARIANAKAAGEDVNRKGGEGESYEGRTVDELRERAAELGIKGRSEMDKDELVDALRNH